MQINDTFYLEDYEKYAKFANENNLIIKELDKVENKRIFQLISQPNLTQIEQNNIEIQNLKYWFNNVYTYKEQKYRRLYTLKKPTDEGTLPYNELLALYNEAEEKRARIQQLEAINEATNKVL